MRSITTLLAIAATSALCVSVNAQIIDTFDTGTAHIQQPPPQNGNPVFHEFSGAGPIGGHRQLRIRDGHSGTLGCCTAIDVGDPSGTLEFWGGGTAPEQNVYYGSAINSSGGNGTPVDLNLSKLLTDLIQVDVLGNTDPGRGDGNLSITLFTSSGNVSWSGGHVLVETICISLSDFAGITAAHAADIDGISLHGQGGYWDGAAAQAAAQGEGLILGEVRFGPAIPEPSSFVLACFGLLSLSGFAWRRRRRA